MLAATKILQPLTDLLKGGLKATAAVEWTLELTLEMEKPFADAKASLFKTALLPHPEQGW
jgi:hypothetical protein